MQSIGQNIQAQWEQYGLKHRFIPTIHAAMGDTLLCVATKISNDACKYKLWDKLQVILGMHQIKLGKNIIFVGDKESMIDALVD